MTDNLMSDMFRNHTDLAMAEAQKEKANGYSTSERAALFLKYLIQLCFGSTAKRIEELQARCDELERSVAYIQQKGIRYRGLYSPAESYEYGDLTTYKGSMFCCVRSSQGEYPFRGPVDGQGSGTTSDSWTLAVRHGKDAR